MKQKKARDLVPGDVFSHNNKLEIAEGKWENGYIMVSWMGRWDIVRASPQHYEDIALEIDGDVTVSYFKLEDII